MVFSSKNYPQSMNEIKIRQATIRDLEKLKEFEQGVIAAERAYDSTLKDQTQYYNFRVMLEASNIIVMVAYTETGQIVGSGFARIEKAPEYLVHNKFAYLAFMYTDPEYRRQGVNDRILGGLTDWSRQQGVKEFRLKVYVGNGIAINAYKKFGFKDHAIEMRTNVDDWYD